MKRCKLYHMEEVFWINSVKRASDICYDPLSEFDDILDDPIVNWICNFEDFDFLFAFVAGMDNGCYSFLDYIYPLTIDNFTYKGIIVPVVLNSCSSAENSELVYYSLYAETGSNEQKNCYIKC